MMVNSAATSNEQSIYAALELSKNCWLLAIQIPGRDNPSQRPLPGSDGAQASRSVAPQGIRPVLIVNAHLGSLLSSARQTTAGGQLYRGCAQCL